MPESMRKLNRHTDKTMAFRFLLFQNDRLETLQISILRNIANIIET